MTEPESDPTFVDDIELEDEWSNPLKSRWRGTAIHGNTPFDTTLISHIEGNLYVGGHEFGMVLPKDIQHIVSLYPWGSWEPGPDHDLKSHEVYTMYDSLNQAMDQIDEISDHAVECVLDGPTLIHCQAGLNRSNLISAVVLHKMGRTIGEAIALLREKRSPAVLCNRAFEQWLLDTYADEPYVWKSTPEDEPPTDEEREEAARKLREAADLLRNHIV